MKKICLIPARSGSKGLRDKNMLFLAGKPLIFHTIEAALQSGAFSPEDIYVSTDSEAYAAIIRQTGVTVLLREPELARDQTTSAEVVLDFLQQFSENTLFALLQPTSPLRTAEQVQAAIEQFEKTGARHLVSVSKADKSPALYTTMTADGKLPDIAGVDQNYRRQNSADYYYPNGAIYLSTKEAYLADKSFFTTETCGFEMEKETSIDVDDKADFYQAVGARYFDYQAREQANQALYENRFSTWRAKQLKPNWFLADSRGELLELPEGFSNLAMGGITAATVAANLPQLIGQQIPEMAVVALGVNDLITDYTPAETAQHLEMILKHLQQVGCEVILVKIVYTLYVASVSNQQIAEVNERIDYLGEKWNCEVIDPNSQLAADKQLLYSYTTDGLHFSAAGNTILENFYQTTWTRRLVQ